MAAYAEELEDSFAVEGWKTESSCIVTNMSLLLEIRIIIGKQMILNCKAEEFPLDINI